MENKTNFFPLAPIDVINSGQTALIGLKQVLGSFADWAVRQSPYPYPENLEEAIGLLNAHAEQTFFKDATYGFQKCELRELRDWLESFIENTPVVAAWNVPKIDTGAEFRMVDRYSEPKADHDFIDLGALAKNIAHSCFIDSLHDDIRGAAITKRIDEESGNTDWGIDD